MNDRHRVVRVRKGADFRNRIRLIGKPHSIRKARDWFLNSLVGETREQAHKIYGK